MKIKFSLVGLVFISVLMSFRPAGRADNKPGFTITVNGDQFNNQTFFIPPLDATYCNLYFDYKDDPRAKRTVLTGFKLDNSLQLQINVPIHKSPGSYTFIEDNIPVYMGFQFTYEKDGAASTYFPGKITVNITHYGKVGEYIEGNFSGDLHINEKRKITLTGTFSVKRIKDKT